jgi:hypothetical protein
MSGTILLYLLLLLGLALPAARADSAPLDAQTIVKRSVQANQGDWEAAPQYDFTERDDTGAGSQTYRVLMILGSPYKRLMAVNGTSLSPEQQAAEQAKLDAVMAERRAESKGQRAERIARYEQGRKREHLLMEQMALAFDFALLGEEKLGGYQVYVLKARPRADYQPPNMPAEVLKGMEGKLWIDESTFQWVKVEAEVIHPVSIGGFLARVEPGTRFELEKMPVDIGVWLPEHFSMKSRARILLLFSQRKVKDESYFDYRKAAGAQAQ